MPLLFQILFIVYVHICLKCFALHVDKCINDSSTLFRQKLVLAEQPFKALSLHKGRLYEV